MLESGAVRNSMSAERDPVVNVIHRSMCTLYLFGASGYYEILIRGANKMKKETDCIFFKIEVEPSEGGLLISRHVDGIHRSVNSRTCEFVEVHRSPGLKHVAGASSVALVER